MTKGDTGVLVAAPRLARLERIEAAAAHLTALRDAAARAQRVSAAGPNASPTGDCPTRRNILDAERALFDAVRSR